MKIAAILSILFLGMGIRFLSQNHFDLTSSTSVSRSIAQTDDDLCPENRFQLPQLKNEVRRLERQQNGPPLTGEWRGLDLAHLSRPAARYLLERGHTIYESPAENFRDCDDIPCILNKIYRSEDSIEGWLSWYFYLKTGYAIAATDGIPGQPAGTFLGKTYDVAEFLFSPSEILTLIRVAEEISPRMIAMSSLQAIYRSPREASFVKADGSSVAFYRGSDKFIILGSWNFKSTDDQPHEAWISQGRGTVLHELAHAHDNNPGRPIENRLAFHAIGGWFSVEVLNPDQQTYSEKWIVGKKLSSPENSAVEISSYVDDPTTESPPTNYGKTNPYEDFAETVELSLFSKGDLLQTHPRRIALLREDLWGKLPLTDLERSEAIEKNLRQEFRLQYLKGFPERPIDLAFHRTLSQLSRENPYTCEFLKSAKGTLFKEKLESTAAEIFAEPGLSEKSLLAKSEILFRESLQYPIEWAKAWLACQNQLHPQECYASRTQALVPPTLSGLAGPPRSEIAAFSTRLLEEKLLPHLIPLRNAMGQLFRTCKIQGTLTDRLAGGFDPNHFKLRPLAPPYGFVDPRVVHCLNQSIESEMHLLANTIQDAEGVITSPTVQQNVQKWIYDRAAFEIFALWKESQKKETEAIDLYLKQVSAALKDILRTDRSWKGTVDCETQFRNVFEKNILNRSDSQDWFLYTAYGTSVGPTAQKTCEGL